MSKTADRCVLKGPMYSTVSVPVPRVFMGLAAAVILGLPAVAPAGGAKWLARAGEHYGQRLSVVVENRSGHELKSVPVTLAVAEVRKVAGALPGRSVVVVEAEAAPAWPWMKDAIVDSQLDDLDGDAQADELTFLAALAPAQKKRYFIYSTDDDLPPPQFPRRTQITPFSADPNAYFAIESDCFMFRFAKEAEGVAKSEMPKEGVIVVATAKAKPGQEDAVKEALLPLVEPTRKEPGCLCYNLHQAKDDKTQFMFYEQWASKEALDAHGKTPHLRALGEKLKDRVEKGGMTFYELLR